MLFFQEARPSGALFFRREAVSMNPKKQMTRKSWRITGLIFYHYFLISLTVLGGGIAIMTASEEIFAKKYRFFREGEITDMLAVIQTVPGLMAGNVAIYVGYRIQKWRGAFAALAGVGLPSLLIILAVSMGLSRMPIDNPYLQGAFTGVRTALCGLTLAVLIRVWRKNMGDWFGYLIGLGCCGGVVLANWNAAWILGGAVLAGVLYFYLSCRKLDRRNLTDDNKVA